MTRAAAIHPGKGLAVAILLLIGVELLLHQDAVLHRLRSVFAAGRALDKVLYVERNTPELLIIGNSRADNAFDPATVLAGMGSAAPRRAFNLGLPGADARVLFGIMKRLDRAGVFGNGGVAAVALSLDEALVQDIDSLGQDVFFADRQTMLADAQYHDWLRTVFRLYGYSDNLRHLREPRTLERFLRAVSQDSEPVGGGAAEHLGYRAGFGALQDKAAALRQEAGSRKPPSEENVRNLWRILDLLSQRGVRVAVVFPPLLNRNVLYLGDDASASPPFIAILRELLRRGIPVIVLDDRVPRDPAEFVNAGHLNDQGAQRYSTLLGQALSGIWPVAAAP